MNEAEHDNDHWLTRVKLRYLTGAVQQERPTSVILLGQPGAGKSVLAEALCRAFIDTGQCAVINPQELLDIRSDSAAQERGREKSRPTSASTKCASDFLFEAALQARCNLILDGVVNDVKSAQRVTRRLKENAYATVVMALCVPKSESWQSLIQRDEHLHAGGVIRPPVPEALHDRMFNEIPLILEDLERHCSVDALSVVTRTGALLYFGAPGPQNAVAAADALRASRAGNVSRGRCHSSTESCSAKSPNLLVHRAGDRSIRLGAFPASRPDQAINSTSGSAAHREPKAVRSPPGIGAGTESGDGPPAGDGSRANAETSSGDEPDEASASVEGRNDASSAKLDGGLDPRRQRREWQEKVRRAARAVARQLEDGE